MGAGALQGNAGVAGGRIACFEREIAVRDTRFAACRSRYFHVLTMPYSFGRVCRKLKGYILRAIQTQ